MAKSPLDALVSSLNYTIEPFYYLVDETSFFSKHFVEQLKIKFLGKVTSENYVIRYAGDLDIDTFSDGIQNLSLFSSKKLIVVKDADRLLEAKSKKISELLKSKIQDHCFVFVSLKKAKHGVYKFCQKQKKMWVFKKPYDSEIQAWIQWMAKRQRKTIDPMAPQLLFEKVGAELNILENEIEKLSLFVGQNQSGIRAEDVEALLYVSRAKSIFELTDALGKKDKAKALFILESILQSGEPEIFVFTMLVRHLRNLWKAKEWQRQKPDVEIQRQLGIHPYFWNQFCTQLQGWKKTKFEPIWKKVSQIDQSLKSQAIDRRSILTGFVGELTN